MSMPTFPENACEITTEQAFTMLLASIAMEELALSHIMNTEGEKLQYVLGTLHDGQSPCYRTPHELLEVNESITRLLDMVLQNQLVLKGKLSQVLEAWGHHCPQPVPKPPCPPCKPEPPPKHGWHCPGDCPFYSSPRPGAAY